MTNIDKKRQSDDVQTHIKASFEFIEKYLPRRYVPQVQEKLRQNGKDVVASGTIRNIRGKGLTDRKYQNLQVITALLDVAKDVEKEQRGFIESVSEIPAEE